jgi:hypothetical protein
VLDEGEHPHEDDVVAERNAGEKQDRAADHDRQRELSLVLVQARRDEGP